MAKKITKFIVNGQDALVAESALAGQLLPPPVSGGYRQNCCS